MCHSPKEVEVGKSPDAHIRSSAIRAGGRHASFRPPIAHRGAGITAPTMTWALRVGCLWQRGCDLGWRPFPGGSCDGDEEYHFDEASEEIVDPRFADGRHDDGDYVEDADDDVDDPVDSWFEQE